MLCGNGPTRFLVKHYTCNIISVPDTLPSTCAVSQPALAFKEEENLVLASQVCAHATSQSCMQSPWIQANSLPKLCTEADSLDGLYGKLLNANILRQFRMFEQDARRIYDSDKGPFSLPIDFLKV